MLDVALSRSSNGLYPDSVTTPDNVTTDELKTRLSLLLAEAEEIAAQLDPADVAHVSRAETLPNLQRALDSAPDWLSQNSLLTHAPDPVFITDRQGNVLAVNPAACELVAQGVAVCLEKPAAISQLATAIRTALDG